MKKILRLSLIFVTLVAILSLKLIPSNAGYDDTKATNDPSLLATYYQNVDTSLSGEDFRRNLSAVISEGYERHAYSGGSADVAAILRESDADPSGNGNVICIYSGLSMPSNQTGGAYEWDKEHVWAKSHGFPKESGDMKEAYSDAHNLRPALSSINRSRSNKDHGLVTNPTREDFGSKQNETTFEPRDEVKGDVARIMFYMATRYGFGEKLNLALVEDATTSAAEYDGRFGNLQTLIQWHYDDPVSESEIYRNNVVYGYQKNRNPYIDHPEYVALAYPANQEDLTIDAEKIAEVKQAISNLPEGITLEDENRIHAVKALYDGLNSLEKSKIDNYSILKNALASLKALQGPTYSYSFESKVFSSPAEIQNLSGIDWTLKATSKNEEGFIGFYQAAKGIQFGSAANPFSLIELSSSKITKVTKIKVYASGAANVDASLSLSVGKYHASKDYSLTNEKTAYEFEFSQANGAVVISINNNSDKAVYIQKIEIYYTEVDLVSDTFVLTQTHSSLKLNCDSTTLEPIEVDLRFGVKMLEDAYCSDAKYGIIVLNSDQIHLLSNGEKPYSSIGGLIEEGHYLELTPIRVNAKGEEDSNGEYFQFAWVITNMKEHYNDLLAAVVYMEYNNKVYFGLSDINSVVDAANNYIEEDLVQNEDVKIILQKIIDGANQNSSWLPWV
ncbi:MAG: endonuclease [Roseburia sp.]|nr:endonuclease [Anaeroplasma bactoclasticum]MCM1196254.1 endonuclease [Roseburia sp.]MCM1556857.1 endonuclease [Anaeroplasma bactoclasticum]